jgi:hypothetical protein
LNNHFKKEDVFSQKSLFLAIRKDVESVSWSCSNSLNLMRLVKETDLRASPRVPKTLPI